MKVHIANLIEVGELSEHCANNRIHDMIVFWIAFTVCWSFGRLYASATPFAPPQSFFEIALMEGQDMYNASVIPRMSVKRMAAQGRFPS